MNRLETAVLQTLCYADVFDYPLKRNEIWRYLISNSKQTKSALKLALASLVKKAVVENISGFYFLPNKKGLIELRLKRERASKKKMRLALEVTQHLRKIGTLQAVYLTGAVSMMNASFDDDVDLMLVAQPGTLWRTRLQVLHHLERMGLRRKPTSTDVMDLVCPNIFIDSASLKIPGNKQNLYTAHEVVQATCLWSRSNTNLFLGQNEWVKTYLVHTHIPPNIEKHPLTATYGPKELMAYGLQRIYMWPKKTTEDVSLRYAFFHPGNTSEKVLQNYESRWQHFGLEN